MNDWSLLREYAERSAEAAFETLVRRHVDMVYFAAWRQTGDSDLAEETTQAVFVLLARKAARLGSGVVVAGWLYRTACLTARRALRDQTRRRIKERKAAEMNSSDSDDEAWARMMPHLDAALERLNEADRAAIVLRFLERRKFREVAAVLSVTEDAAKKRVTRALEKLRMVITQRGVILGAAAMAAALSAKGVQAAPAGLVRSSVMAGMSGGGAASAGVGGLVAAVIRDAFISRLKWGVGLAGAGSMLALIVSAHWLTQPNSVEPGEPAVAAAAGGGSPSAGLSPTAFAQPPAAPTDQTNGGVMLLHVVADESGQPLAGMEVRAEFIIIPRSVSAEFVTDGGGTARIVLPTDSLIGMDYWVSAHGRVPMRVAWETKETVESRPAEYTLRMPQGRLVAGTVVEETGQPVAGAAVRFQSEGTQGNSLEYVDYGGPWGLAQTDRPVLPTTDCNGRWSADFISPKAKSLFGYVEHPEFATTQFGHIHPPDPIEPSTNMVLVLERGATVAGVVRDSAGTPILEASVNLRDEFGFPPSSMKTDAAGRFEFPHVGEGDFMLRVDARGFGVGTRLLVRGGAATNLEIALEPAKVAGNSIIRGRVMSEDGKPISGAGVRVAPGQPGLEDIMWGMLTDAEGRFVWSSAPDHAVKLLVGANLISDWEKQQVELAPDGSEGVIVLKPKAMILVHGTVSDKSTGNPLPEFLVLWAPGITNGFVSNTQVLTQGRDGKFSVSLLPEQVKSYSPPGTSTRLDFQAPDHVNRVVSLAAETHDIELAIELEPATDIAGTVLQPDGKLAAGAKVFFRGERFRFRVGEDCFVSMPAREYPFPVETETGADGAFRIPKIDAIERLEVVHPAGWANVPLDGRSTAIVQLQAWGRIAGVVRSNQGLMAGVEVRATEGRTEPQQMLFQFIAKTDGDGRFEFSQVPGGRARVFVRAGLDWEGGPRAEEEVQVGSGEAESVTLTMQGR
jgi:RNA polymerase sigma factor (sigma-70 family)